MVRRKRDREIQEGDAVERSENARFLPVRISTLSSSVQPVIPMRVPGTSRPSRHVAHGDRPRRCISRGGIRSARSQISVLGDANHASFDNLTFADDETLLVTEDRGDALHDQLNKLDSVWAFDIAGHDRRPRRLLALGRDATATSEDNEPTGIFVSDGHTSIAGLLGRKESPRNRTFLASPFLRPARVFSGRGHGDSTTLPGGSSPNSTD